MKKTKEKPTYTYNSHISAFSDILFFRVYSPNIKSLNIFVRCALYGAAILFFYAPIIYSIVSLCIHNLYFTPYLLTVVIMHIVSKLLFHYSKITQLRFTDAKKNRKFVIRILIVLEYIVLMWFVYLFYPLACILFPATMILMFYEKLVGLHFIFDILTTHTDQFISYGGIASYIVFLFMGGYKKLLSGSMPSYLRMYVILAAMSGLIDRAMKILELDKITDSYETFSSAVSHMFSISNQSLNLVSTFVTFSSAIFSLYTTCGLDTRAQEQVSEPTESEPIISGDEG